MKIYTEYKEVKGQTIMITLSYKKDVENRGYYATLVPVKFEERDGYSVKSFLAYSGVTKHLLSVNRRSKKQEAEAIRLLDECEDRLISYILDKNVA